MTGHRTAATGVSQAAAGRWAGAPARPGSKWSASLLCGFATGTLMLQVSPGFVLFSLGLASLVYGLIESGQKSFGNSVVADSFVAAGVLLAAFVLAELRGRHPMFDLALFRLPAFSGGCVAAFGLSASIFAMILYLVLYLQDILGYSAFDTGLR